MAIANAAVHQYGALQDEWELAQLLHIAQISGVRSVLEIGSYTGGSLWAWRQVVPNVYCVTLETGQPFRSHGAKVVAGDSTDIAVQQRMTDMIDGVPLDMVFIDGGHDYETAHSDMLWALGMVHHGLIGLHDINLHIRYPHAEMVGPRQVWEGFRRLMPTFEIANNPPEDPGVGIFFIR